MDRILRCRARRIGRARLRRGIGENSPPIRERICDGLGFLGIELNEGRDEKNASLTTTGAGSRCVLFARMKNS